MERQSQENDNGVQYIECKEKVRKWSETASGLHPAVALPSSKGSMPLIHGQGVLMMDCLLQHGPPPLLIVHSMQLSTVLH